MSVEQMGALRSFALRLRRRFAPRALVLIYHRVVELRDDPYLMAVTPRRFAEQLEVLRHQARPLRLEHLVESLRKGSVPDRAVVVTFDDGYADNLHQARPLLERHDIPATVFVTTGSLGSDREFWWDELERLLLRPGELPPKLQLRVNGRADEWSLGAGARYGEEEYGRHHAWHVERQDDPSPRHSLFRSLYQLLHSLPDGEQQRLLEELRAWAAAPAAVNRPSHRALSEDEVVSLGDGQLVEIGAHGVTHPALALLPPESQREEIRQSKARLEGILGRPVTSFAYPYGSYNAETLAAVREAPFASACSSDPEVVYAGADIFRLPRLVVRDWDGDTFARWLKAFWR